MRVGLIVAALLAATLLGNVVSADDGHPVAIRHWPGGGFTVETMWGLRVGSGLNEDSRKLLPRKPDLEIDSLRLRSSGVLKRAANTSDVEFVANESEELHNDIELEEFEEDQRVVQNEIMVETYEGGTFALEVDGVEILKCGDPNVLKAMLGELERLKELKIANEAVRELPDARLCLIATNAKFDEAMLVRVVNQIQPELLIVSSAIDSINGQAVDHIEHNTIAISSSGKRNKETRIVSLGTEPYRMNGELAELFAAKEVSQAATCEMFRKLSVEQMNFKPSNGSHTPRWNAEHMMGRELVFFSQIYNAVDPSISVMNLNPKQMPKDYEFAHPDWTGEEEARQIERVRDFTRRFAYLLDGMDLNKKAKGSRFWSSKALLLQMERHYKEHSANVVKKMKLEDWPASNSKVETDAK